jgi:hypothetical protein
MITKIYQPNERGKCMKCPNCGYNRQKRDDAFVPATECPSCGIVYSKHDGVAVPGLPISTATTSTPLRPSAVDPESLKKAKERVEKRLRDRLEAPVRDERHAKTLELARKLTSSAARNRHEKAAQNKKTEKAAMEDQNPASEHDDEPSEDPLLLENAIGVQLHSGQNDVEPETLDDETAIHETMPDNDEVEISADSNPEMPDVPLPDNPNTDQTLAYPEDVQVETVLLGPDEHKAAATSEAPPEPEDSIPVNESMEPEETDLPPAYIADASTAPKTLHAGINLKSLLPIIAWLILFTGVIGAVLSWTTITDVEAGVKVHGTIGPTALPLGLLLGFAYLATGALGFAFFWVSSLINRQLKDIQRLLMVHPIAMFPDQTGADQTDGVEK